ncbi:MAG: hypothetical protein WEB57_08225 [Pseudohongiellaceae bacterium]
MSELNAHQTDYQGILQESALGFLRRHQAEYLDDNQSLFNRAVQTLQIVHSASKEVAENCVARAYGELRGRGDAPHLDISLSTAYSAVIVDPNTGMYYVVPVEDIVQRLINRRKPTIRSVQ